MRLNEDEVENEEVESEQDRIDEADDEAVEVGTDGEEVESGDSAGDQIGKNYREKYGKEGHCGDDIATLLKAACLDEEGKKVDSDKVTAIGDTNGIDMAKYAHLNVGMQRMNLGNRLRGLHNKGTDITIGEDTVAGAVQEEKATPEVEAAE
jgi:hypothetical protein